MYAEAKQDGVPALCGIRISTWTSVCAVPNTMMSHSLLDYVCRVPGGNATKMAGKSNAR